MGGMASSVQLRRVEKLPLTSCTSAKHVKSPFTSLVDVTRTARIWKYCHSIGPGHSAESHLPNPLVRQIRTNCVLHQLLN
jgi:hypothetical protein